MFVVKLKSAWAALIRKFKKFSERRSEPYYPSERIERFERYHNERFMRFL